MKLIETIELIYLITQVLLPGSAAVLLVHLFFPY